MNLFMNMNHQDFTEVVFRKNNPTEKKTLYQKSTEQKLDEEHDELKHKTIGISMANKIRNARIAKNFSTQKELANAMHESVDKIKSYENGKAIPDHAMMQKLRRHLQIKL